MQYYESSSYGKWCKHIYGNDLKQMGMVTMKELELFYQEVELSPGSLLLDIGCGPGYITAALAKHYNSRSIGIDIDIGSISHAKEIFSGNPALSFQCMNGNEVSFVASSFDLIYLFDTLYFTVSIAELRMLLDKCLHMLKPGGRLAIFWSNHPIREREIFKMKEPGASNTQVGIWGSERNILIKTFDLTQDYRKFWINAQKEITAMRYELISEIPEVYASLINECSLYSKLCVEGDAGGMYRWLYIFTKQ